jgi:tetratricopeptide (TPR) repeat protein
MPRRSFIVFLAIAAFLPQSFVPAESAPLEVLRQHINRGNALMQARHFTEAINEYQEVLKLDPGNLIAKANIAEAHNNWGIFYYGQHKYKEAIAEWQKCLELSPGHANAKRNIALLKRIAAQQGIDLTDDSAQPGVDPLATINAGGKPSSKESSAAPDATSGGTAIAPAAGKQEEPIEAPPSDTGVSGAVMIISPALKQSMDQSSGTAGDYSTAGGSGVNPTPVYGQGTAAAVQPVRKPARVNPLFPVLPTQFVDDGAGGAPAAGPGGTATSSGAVLLTPTAPATTPSYGAGTPAATPSYNPAPGAATPAANSLDDQLAAVEMKVYGQKETGLTVLQRLEKIEKDTAGATRSGTIIERIDYLKKSFGL